MSFFYSSVKKKISILWQDKKNLNIKNFLCLWPLSPHYCALCTCIIHWPNFPHQQKYLLNHKEQPSSISQITLWKITFLLGLVRCHDDPSLCTYRYELCKLPIICHLMYSPLSQKNLYNCVLTSNRQNSSQRFLRGCSGL